MIYIVTNTATTAMLRTDPFFLFVNVNVAIRVTHAKIRVRLDAVARALRKIVAAFQSFPARSLSHHVRFVHSKQHVLSVVSYEGSQVQTD